MTSRRPPVRSVRCSSALSFFRLAYDDFAGYRAVLDRLTGLLDVNDEARALPTPTTEDRPNGLAVRDLQVRLPDGRPLLSDLQFGVEAGGTLLITGPSGTGKTTLLRSMAGLWPHADGSVERPDGRGDPVLLPAAVPAAGPLRGALSYPAPAAELSDDEARAVLQTVQLAHLGDDLDLERDWSRRLSPGEQQRLSFGRILLRKPALIFLDESTSAMDEGMEHAMYEHVREVLPAVHDRQRRPPQQPRAAARRRAGPAGRRSLGGRAAQPLSRPGRVRTRPCT